MARKFDLISELYERTCFAVTDNPVNWQSFLKTAGRNFRLRFDEQLLIYAQRPDATAVLEIERWNGTFGRWVNRGAKGIAVFEDTDRSRQRLIHYFDISDTHESRHSRPVPIWEMRPEYEAEVIETLENTFGAVNDTTSIENVVKESIANAVEDNIADYISDFMSLGAGSDIEYLSADEANALYLELVRNSVSYMVMARLGLNADKVYSPDDFAGISSFNSQEVLNAVGIATSDIAEMALLPVSRTISTLSKENRIIDEQEQSEYNKDIKDERSQSDERNHIHDGGRLQSSEPETAGADGSDSRQMVADEENLSEGTSQNPVLQSSDERDSEQSLGGGSAESQRTGGNSREADGTESRADGADESGRYDEVGSPDEQHQELGTGNREESGNIRLTRPEQELFLSYLKNTPSASLWYPIFAVLVGTGLRVGEATGLRWCDIDLDEGIINVNHTLVYYDHRTDGSKRGCYFNINTTKTPAGKRQVPMLDFVKEAFLMEKERQELLDIHCEAVVDGYTDFIFLNRFGQPQHQATLNKAIRRIIRDCNDEQLLKDENAKVLLPHFSCHSLRHTFTTRMCEAGVNVKVIQDTLGHKDISTTLNIYTDVTKELRRSEFEGLDSYFKNEYNKANEVL